LIVKKEDRDNAIQELLTSGVGLKNLYRFVVQNPHLDLYDASQIVISRPNASICFTFDEWNAMNRRVTKGRKGIAYYDSDGHKQYVFDMNDTHGERYKREVLPMKVLLKGLEVLCETGYKETSADFYKIEGGVLEYYKKNDMLTEDSIKNRLIVEGVAYMLYSKTSYPKMHNIALRGIPYSLKENGELFKTIYKESIALQQEIEDVYLRSKEEVPVINDVDEETITDEPIIISEPKPEPEIKPKVPEPESKHVLHPIYKRYMEEQSKRPDAVVIQRLGDFYEIMGEKAVEISDRLDLTLTGRDFGLSERIPMIGFPYHVTDKYIEKILETNGVVLIDGDEEPKYILSHSEAKEDFDLPSENEDELEIYDGEIDEEYFEPIRPELELLEDDSGFEEFDEYIKAREKENEEIEVQPQEEKAKPKPQRPRKKKDKPQLSMFDMLEPEEPEEETLEDKLIEHELTSGSGFENGKFRINSYYLLNPTTKEFADFLKHEYGVGGRSGGEYSTFHDAKGIRMAFRDENTREHLAEANLNWNQVAKYISEYIDDDIYLNEEEKVEFKKYQARRYGSDEDRIKAIADWMVEYGTDRTWNGTYLDYNFSDNYKFASEHLEEIKAELETRKEVEKVEHTSTFYATHNLAVTFYPEYCDYIKRQKQKEIEKLNEEPEEENTDLTEVGFDQSELGGAKTRFRNNVAAIKLLNKLNHEARTATSEERKILAKYVGWGGLAQAFDENNESWQKEYKELKELLSTQDYITAKGTVLNAHFTSKEVIDGIYKALERFGVKENNKILEPAMGTGNFFGFMPIEISNSAKLYGVELDNITGQIAKKLYPNANVQIKGFEKTTFSDNFFDVVVGNVPFGAYSVHDSYYNKYNFYIHDYFLAKSIDKLKPKGIMAVITSSGTMDKQSPKTRKYLADRAELLGAIRLPNTAFKQTAGTEVVADILFFKKREEKIDAKLEDNSWIGTGENSQGFILNNYFIEHPEMVLGSLIEERGLYGAISLTVKADERELSKALSEAITNLPSQVYSNPETPPIAEETSSIELDYDLKPLCYKAKDGKIYMRIGDSMVEQQIPPYPKDAYQRIVGMINIRKQLRNLLSLQNEGCSDEKLQTEQWALNSQYDIFVKKYGIINSQTNIRLFKDDADSSLLRSCENLSEDKKTATKADIFFKRTIRPYVVVTSTDDCFEALQISKNEHGKVDIAYIEELTKKDYDTVINELGTAVFRNPIMVNPEDKYSGFETAEEYLSGMVVKKLELAKKYSEEYPEMGYQKNVISLGQVQPEKINASDISVRIGTTWIDTDYYLQFLCKLLAIPVYYRDGLSIYYNKHDSSWRVDKSSYINNCSYMNVHEVYGTSRASAYRLFEDCLNLRSTAIYDTVEEDGREKRVVNQIETIAAREKQNEIKEKFREWIFETPERRDELEKTYNSKFNQIRLPTYDGSYLKFPEMNPAIELRPHQKNAVHRIITSGNTLLHHVVGSGKTYTICATIMKLRQYGLAKKPLIAVPNHLTEQWANSFRYLYPNSNILVAQKEDLDKEHRERFVSRVALGDWDAVIMAQSSFAKIPISKERQVAKIQEEISRIEETIEYQRFNSNHPTGSVKNLERIKKNREAQLNKLLDESKKDSVLIFENLGVDYLFIDEAHYYKNLFLFTKMNNVSGISNAASQRASDLELKIEYINELHGGDKGVVFATGTPISNSMTEMYTMQRYLQRRTLEDVGINFFDNWASSFGETIQSLELAPSGQGYKSKTRFAKFVNLPELLTMYRSFADVQTADMVKLDVPIAERKVVNLKPSDAVLQLAEEIAERAERIHDGSVDPHEDNMLKVTSDGKKLALDPRCMDRYAPDEEGSKINACAQNVFEEWTESKDINGTQLVFCDLSTPKKSYEEYEYGKDFDVYNDLKHKLVEKGIPEQQIAFIHDAKNDKLKQSLFDKVNFGSVRVLIGSTEKCGAGTNVQERLVALHHLDTPYRPSDLEQRDGRGIRQGNINKSIRIYTYVKERTFDSYSYQILENKQRFISQVNKGDLTIREADDIDEATLSYAEIKAITSANPKIKRKMEVDSEVQRLRVLESQYRKSLYTLQDKIHKYYPEEIQRQTLYLERLRKDIDIVNDKFNPDEFKLNVLGTEFTDKKLGGQALLNALQSYKSETIVAEYAGFKISLNPMVLMSAERSITLSASGRYSMNIGESATGLLTRLDNFFTEFSGREERASTKLEQLKTDLKVAKEQEKKPFERAEELSALLKEQAELNAELDLNKKEEVVMLEENEDDNVVSKMIEQEPKEFRANKNKSRKKLTKTQENMYDIEQAKTPDSYVFIKNGSYYDVYGEKAKILAEKYNMEILTENDKSVFTINIDQLETIVRETVDAGNQVKIIESPMVEKEVVFVENEDKVANLEVPILPSYSITKEGMHQYGYKWDGMLPISRKTARTLERIGLQLFKLYEDGSESEVKDENDFNFHKGIYGIEKPVWNDFLESSDGKNYVAARLAMCDSASSVINEELASVSEQYTINFNNTNYNEKKSLSSYISGKDVSVEEMRKYIPTLLSEFTDRIYDDVLEYYGCDKNNVGSFLSDNLQPDELLEEANKEVDRWKLIDYLQDGMYKHHILDLMKGKSIGKLDDNDAADSVLVELKEHFENTEWSEGFEDVAYDEWYDEFSEYTLKPILMGENYNKAEEIILNEMENMSDEEVLDFLDINVNYKEKVIERVEKEHEKFLNEMKKLSPEEIISNNYQIHVKNELHAVITEGEYLNGEHYRALYQVGDGLLNELYLDFIGEEFASVNNFSEGADFVKNYCQNYYSEYIITDEQVEELKITQYLLDACKLDEILLTMENGEIVAVDENNTKWQGKEFYEFLFNEALQLEADYKLVPGYGVSQGIVDSVLKYSKHYNPEIHTVKPSHYFKVKDFNEEEVRLKPSLELYTVSDGITDDKQYGIAIRLNEYNANKNEDLGQYAILTKSFGEFIGYKNTAYIDVNNCPFANQLLDLGIAKETGFTKQSGFVTYPLWQFDEEFLKEIGTENYEKYSNKYDEYMSQFNEVEEIEDYKEAVVNDVQSEWNKFEEEIKSLPAHEVFKYSHEIYSKEQLKKGIESLELDEKYYQALYEEKGNILDNLYSEFFAKEDVSLSSVDDVNIYLENYCIDNYKDVIRGQENDFEYFGKDGKDTGFYYFKDALSVDNLHRVNEESDDYIIAAPVCYMSQESLEEKNITFLKIGRDIDETELKLGGESAMFAMRASFNKKMPLEATMVSFDCMYDIEKDIKNNFDGKHLNTENISILYALYGEERMNYVLANTVQRLNDDGRFSPSNKEWAKGININNSDEDRLHFTITSHPAVVDGYITSYRKMVKDFKEKLDKEGEMPDNEQTKNKWITVNVSQQALIKRYDKNSYMRMPLTGEYAGYTYNVFNNRIKDSHQLVDLESDGRELSYQLLFVENEVIKIKNKDEKEITFTVNEFKEIVDGTSNKDYVNVKNYDEKSWFIIDAPKESIVAEYPNSTRFMTPKTAVLKGFTFSLPNGFINENIENKDGRLSIVIPNDFKVVAKSPEGEETTIEAYNLHAIMNSTEKSAYNYSKKENPKEKQETKWQYVSVSKEAILREKNDSVLFKMPKGQYEGYSYYIPNSLITENENKETVVLKLPENFVIKAKNNRAEKEEEKSVDFVVNEFVKAVRGKKVEDYVTNYKRPSESRANPFDTVEEKLVKNVPKEMKDRPNWVAVKIWYNEEKGRLEKRPINCKNGEYAESDNPETWTDFESARKFAKENGCKTLAYALDGKDGICCIDVDNCYKDGKGHSELVTDLIQKSDGTYRETSISGKGVHFFGKTAGIDVRTFSKDGDLEFYQKDHFIAMTGDLEVKSNGITNFDRTEVETLIRNKCEKRTYLSGTGKGVEGLSKMNDRDVVEKACSSKGGDTFKALYNGQDLQNNHSNSDMSLMNRLAFWCNGDKEQMLRIFATSGLYRPNKSPDYYECTVIKAIRDTTERFQPNQKTSFSPTNIKGNSFDKGGR